jgi:PadR family transcriptional regulator, regulatory protein PadR
MTLSGLEYHVLLSLADGARHGFAIAERVAIDSGGALRPRAGSLYRVVARLIVEGWVDEREAEDEEPHPGLPRRYYRLTAAGRLSLAQEAARLRHASTVALKRLGARS